MKKPDCYSEYKILISKVKEVCCMPTPPLVISGRCDNCPEYFHNKYVKGSYNPYEVEKDEEIAEEEVAEKKVVLKIIQDSDTESPRENDNIGTMICFHRGYTLGDKHNYSSPRDFLEDLIKSLDENLVEIICKLADYSEADDYNYFGNKHEFAINNLCELSQDELIEVIEDSGTIILPLYLYEHSGITMRTSSFSCRWDSGMIGWIYCTKEKAIYEFDESTWKERAENYLQGEVVTYDQYLTGDIYGFRLVEVDEDGEEIDEIDSCYGFYGRDPRENGMADHIGKEYYYLLEDPIYE